MKELLKKQYDLLESKTFRYWFVFGIALFGLIFLWTFEPYGLYNLTTFDEKALAIGLYTGIGLLLLIFQFFLLQNIFIRKYTLGITILWIILSFLIIGTSSFIINTFLYNEGRFYFSIFIYFQGMILSINIIPVILFVLIHYNLTLRKRLRMAVQINSSIQNKSQNSDKGQIVVLNSENRNDKLELSLNSLLFITSVDNYIDVYYIDNRIIKHKLLRYSLAAIEQDNPNIADLFRCHKSYIVNKTKIDSITGNAAGYKLRLKEYSDYIPVSRKWNKQIKDICV
jgi:hypothetical protein